jgi:hypothetical protein
MIEVTEVSYPEFEAAVRGMRNSWDSHDKSDSTWFSKNDEVKKELQLIYNIGENDLKLMKKLVRAGSDHAKFMRQITLSFDLNSPLYFWKQFDTYKVGTTANSESTMHTINRKGFWKTDSYGYQQYSEDMFSFDYGFIEELKESNNFADQEVCVFIKNMFETLELTREAYNMTKDKRYWDLLIALLPSGFNQKRTVTLNYAVLASMYHSRKSHKLKEWHEFCDWIKTLPYSELITGEEKENAS